MQDIHAWRRPAELGPTPSATSTTTARSLGAGRSATEAFYRQHLLGVDRRIEDGFRDAGGGCDPNGGPGTNMGDAIVLVDRERDCRLVEWLESVSKRLRKAGDDVTKIMVAALLISEALGRAANDVRAMEQRCEGLIIERLNEADGAIMLGELLADRRGSGTEVHSGERRSGAGGVRVRAVLLKAVADWLALAPSELRRDTMGRTWNVVLFNGGARYVVDVVIDPGAMYEEDSVRTAEYLSLLAHQGHGDSKMGAEGRKSGVRNCVLVTPPPSQQNVQGRMARPAWHVEPWEMEFDRRDRVGRGGFGEVFCGTWAGQQVAVKEVQDANPTDGEVCDFVLEISLLSGLSHPNIVRFWRGCVDLRRGSRTLLLVTEWMDCGTLSALLHEAQEPVLSVKESLVLALSVARGVAYLHDVGILHLDLKSPNVLLNSSFHAKLCDFGLAKVREQVGAHTMLRGISPVWASPEMFDDSVGGITERADVYSFGIVVFEIFTQQMPFMEVEQMQLTRVKSKGQLPEFPAGLDTDIAELSRLCLARRPGDRIMMPAVVAQLRQAFRVRKLDPQRESDQMRMRGLRVLTCGSLGGVVGGAPAVGPRVDEVRRLELEERAIEADVARLRKQLQDEEEKMRLVEDQIRQRASSVDGQADSERMEAFCKGHTERLEDMKFRCNLCMKFFRGRDFVHRHIREQHFSDMLLDLAKLPQQPCRPSTSGGGQSPQRGRDDKFFDSDIAKESNAKVYTDKISNDRTVDLLLDAARSGDFERLQQLHRQGGATVAIPKDADGCTALHLGASGGHVDVVRYLISNAADLTAGNDSGMTALHLAAQEAHGRTCELLLESGSPVDAQDRLKMRTPLHMAATHGHRELCAALLAHRAGVDVQDSEGGSALHHAARFGDPGLCELVLSWGARVNARDNDGWCPLHEAARWASVELVDSLLQRGAELHAESNDGDGVLHVVPGGYAEPEVVELLLERRASVNAQNFDGETPLHVAAKLGDEELAGVFLCSSADVNSKTKSGCTPLDLAKKDEIRWLLCSHKAKRGSGTA